MKTTLILISFLLVLGSCASKDSLENKQASLYFAAGTQSLVEENYTDALANLLKADKMDPDNADIITNVGMAYYFKGEKALALKNLNRALELNPNHTDAKVNLASIAYKDGKIDEAEAMYKKVLEDLTYDKQARTYFNLGLIEKNHHHNTQAALAYFEKSAKEDSNYCPAFFEMGLIQFKLRQFQSALKNFKESSMGTCYNTPVGHYYQALTLIELKRYDEARNKLESIESRFKSTPFAVNAKARRMELNEATPASYHATPTQRTESLDF